MTVPFLGKDSLVRRFAVAAAILAAAAVFLTSLASYWVISQQRAAAVRTLQQKEAAFHAAAASRMLHGISTRMNEIAGNPLLATGLVDSAGREMYLSPFLQGVRQINGIPVHLLFTDFEGMQISSNGAGSFSHAQLDWLRQQLGKGTIAAAIFPSSNGPELMGVEFLRYSRTASPEGALLYKIKLRDVQPAPMIHLAWGELAGQKASSRLIDAPPIFQPLALRLTGEAQQASGTPLDNFSPQYVVILVMALLLATVVFVLGSRLALLLTSDLRKLEAFSSNLVDQNLSAQRAEPIGSAEVKSLAHSINHMLDRLYQQHTLVQSENAKFYALANTIPQLAWIAEADGTISWYNQRWYAYTGTTPAQMQDLGWQSVIGPSELKRVHESWQTAIDNGSALQMAFPLRGADGVYRNFFTSVAPLRDAGGTIVQWFGTNTDLSAIEAAEQAVHQSEERLQQGLIAGHMAVWDWQIATGGVSFAANLHSVFGQDWRAMEDVWPLVHPEDLVQLRDAIHTAVLQRNAYQTIVRLQRPTDGGDTWVEMRGKVVQDENGAAHTIQAVAIDVTERKRAEEALRLADRRKDEFLAMLAHELRNPLAPISTAAQLLSLVYAGEPRVRQSSEVISRQVEHMTRLVDDLLDVSRVTRGLVTLQKQTLVMQQIVSGAVDQVRPLIGAKRHQLSVELPDEPIYVDGDQTRLIQVVANLLNNAAKYTPPGGRITLRASIQDNQIALQIQDNGVGISQELLPDVFELFTQGQRTPDRSQGGLGLGLALVRKLVELHGGNVVASSGGTGAGSQFTVFLPCLNGAAPFLPEPRSATPAAPNHALRLMVVDDNIDAANSLAMLLEVEGHQVLVAHTAHEALARAPAAGPQVCILDIGLPDMDGNELAQRLRASPHTAHAVLIAVTGYGQEQDRKNAAVAGFDHYFVKPLNTGKLAGLLDKISRTSTG